jgi:RNA polymerase sigma-70 factor (ECF subfamily)
MLDDKQIKSLLLRTAARDEGCAEAFERLYRTCAPLLLGVARRIVLRQELAEEVLQDSFMRIWVAAERFDPIADRPVAWMVAITRNRAIDLCASHDMARVQTYGDDAFADPDGALEKLFDWSETGEVVEDQRRVRAWLRQCLSQLQGVERQSLVLAYVQGLSHSELAAHLRKPLGTIKSWLRRGMANLRECVETCMGTNR